MGPIISWQGGNDRNINAQYKRYHEYDIITNIILSQTLYYHKDDIITNIILSQIWYQDITIIEKQSRAE